MASAKKESKFFDILKTQLSHTCPLNAYEIIVTEIRLPLFQIPFEAFSKGVRKDAAPSMLFYLDFYSVDNNNNTCVKT